MPLAVLRCDASPSIGLGHVVRSMALAEALAEDGWQVAFATRGETWAAMQGLGFERWPALRLDGPPAAEPEQMRARWPEGVDVLIADHYQRDAAFESALRPWSRRIVAIDDVPGRPHDCDLLIDSLPGRVAGDYAPLVPASCRFLLGHAYALLRGGFARQRSKALALRKTRVLSARGLRVLIAPGGGEQTDAALLSLEALALSGLALEADLLLGASRAREGEIKAAAGRFGLKVRLFFGHEDVAGLIEDADFCLGAAGASTWERCCLGLPALLLTMAENQNAIAKSAQKAGAAIWLGDIADAKADAIARELRRVAGEPTILAAMSEAATRLCDGWGALRAARAIDSMCAEHALSQAAPQTSPAWWRRKPRRISVVVDNPSWILDYAHRLVALTNQGGDEAVLCRSHSEIAPGDIAFYLGCVRITPEDILALNHKNLVVHASDLPRGRGFSPLSWRVIEGACAIPVRLIEAARGVDEGDIVGQDEIALAGHELLPELHVLLGNMTVELCRRYLNAAALPEGVPQEGEASYYPRRRPADSRLDPEKSLASQFDLLRITDNQRYPAFFSWRGRSYRLTIEKMEEDGP